MNSHSGCSKHENRDAKFDPPVVAMKPQRLLLLLVALDAVNQAAPFVTAPARARRRLHQASTTERQHRHCRPLAAQKQNDPEDEGEHAGDEGLLARITSTLQQPLKFQLPTWDQIKLFTGGSVAGLLGGLVLAVGLLIDPLGTPSGGIGQSLDLFENVLVDLDEVRD